MSQTAPGEAGGSGNSSHSSNKFFQQPLQAPVGTNYLSQGQGGAQYGSFIPHFPVKPTNPHMGNGYRPNGPMQFNMHSSHMNPQQQQQHIHQINSMKGRGDANCAPMPHPYQQNQCGNVQYISGGNYVTTITVNPGDHHHQNQVVHPIQQQYMHNPQNYYMNSSGTAIMNQINTNMNYMQNMIIQPNANKNIHSSEKSQRNEPIPVSNLNAENHSDTQNKALTHTSKDSKTNENFHSNPLINQKIIKHCKNNVSENLEENVNGDLSNTQVNVNNNGQKISGNNSAIPLQKNCTNVSGNVNILSNRPRTNSRCDSVRSEAGESTCSSLSTESTPDQNQLHHHHQHAFNIKNNQQHYHFPNNQIQPMNNFNGNMNNNGNMNYQNYMACQARMNQVAGKPGMYSNPNVVQAFQQVNTVQHVQVQHGQVQIMQQQYQSLQNPSGGVTRPAMGGGIPNTGVPQGQPSSVMAASGNVSAQGKSVLTPGMLPDHSNSHVQNMNMPPTCIGPAGSVPPQNMTGAASHGPYPHQAGMHSQGKATLLGLQQPNMVMGMAGALPGGTNPLNKGFPPVVVVPFGWKRFDTNGQIVYVSPSGSELRSPMEVCEYLTQENTCKCGLQCPLRVENIFCFDPKVRHRLTMPDELSSGEATKVCNHRRKLALAFSHHLQKQAKKEDGRKKRKRKCTEALESPTPCSTPSPAIGHPPSNQMVALNSQQQQQQDPSLMHQQQQQQQQQHIYQTNQNPNQYMFQNWNGMYGVGARIMMPNGGMGGSQANPENYSAMNNSSCSTSAPFPNQHNQNCCDGHHCFTGHHNPPAMGHQGMRPTMAGMTRPPFGRMPGDAMFKGMIPQQGGCAPQQQMQQQFAHHPMMGANRAPLPAMPNNPICRMPSNSNDMQMYVSGGLNAPGSEGLPVTLDAVPVSKTSLPDEVEKRRRGSTARSRKKAKTVVDRNSPCPNVDVRNMRTESAVSPHTGPGPPFPSASPLAQQNSSDSQVGSSGTEASQIPLAVSGPSFMEDPSGYLAQQTVLLNNTMSGGGVGQFSPQGARLSPRPSVPSSQASSSSSLPPKTTQGGGFTSRSLISTPRTALPSPTVVPLPSNVPLPARVSKASVVTSSTSSASPSQAASSCSVSVHSKSNTSLSTSGGESKPKPESDPAPAQEKPKTMVATAESSFVNHTVTVTYTSSSVTTTTSCGNESNSPHSSQDADHSELTFSHAEPLTTSERYLSSSHTGKASKALSAVSTVKNLNNKLKRFESQKKKSDVIVPDSLCTNSGRSSSNASSGSSLSVEAANKPLTPGPAESSMNTQSPLEMVQNIVSSIPLPTTSEELTPIPNKMHNHHPQPLIPDHPPSAAAQQSLPHQQLLGPHVYNMNAGNMTGVMYNPNGGPQNMLRSTGSLVVHGATGSGSIPPVLVSNNSGNMVVVTSPFNSKVSIPSPVVCSNVTGIAPMVGVQTVPQMQVQPSLANVQPHLQQIQPVQPVVQFVNTFATMQTPVIIQNGSNLLQSPSGVSLIPSSTPAFVTNQPLLAVDSSSHSSHMQMTHVVTSASSEASDDSCSNRLTPVTTPMSTPTTPHSRPGSETPPSGGSSSGSGRKRKRRRNTSTPQGNQQQQQNIVPAIIMGKQLPQQMVVNGTQISQVAPYTGTQMATVATMGPSGAPATAGGQMLATAGQPANSINVVQMVGGPVAGPLPMHLQQPHTILLPSTATPGVIINQLPDGTFVSTDPSSGVTYPVQLQLSGSHIVGVSPVANPPPPPPAPTPTGVVAVRPSPPVQTNSVIGTGPKLINLSPGISSSQGAETLVNRVYDGIVGGGEYRPPQGEDAPLQQMVRKTTTIVAQQTTVVATQGGLLGGTHSSVSTQTPRLLGESDVTSSDCVANSTQARHTPTSSPSHQSAEVTTTRQDEEVSTPESILVSPQGQSSPESTSKSAPLSREGGQGQGQGQEPHSATATEIGNSSENIGVFWGFHRGHHYWPAQVLHQCGGDVTVRWYGDHSLEKVSLSSLSNFPSNARKVTTRRSHRGRTALDEAIAEADDNGCHHQGSSSPFAKPTITPSSHSNSSQTSSPIEPNINPSSSSVGKSRKRRKQRL